MVGLRLALGCRWALSGILILLAGCDSPSAQFSLNRVYLGYQEDQTDSQVAPQQEQDLVNALTALFGTPDEPFLPEGVEGLETIVRAGRLEAAAGPVGSDAQGRARGLYRQHCVHCHGISGNGLGPTASFLNPYPRDFRRGAFKFASTPIGAKPTHDDLRRILMNGIPGTAMPSFKLLNAGEIDALIDYVKYLAIRGETERRLMEELGDFTDPDNPTENEKLRQEFIAREYLVDEVLSGVVQSWVTADQQAVEVPERPAAYDTNSPEFDEGELQASIERGRKLYYTNVANCFSCHGPAQQGDGQVTDYDSWTKEFFDWTKKADEQYNEKLEKYLALGGLPPRNIQPRNLRTGVYRGGRRPLDIFWRIHNGINGTPMPEANKAALQSDNLWDLVNYVMSLPYEPASQPGVQMVTNERTVQ